MVYDTEFTDRLDQYIKARPHYVRKAMFGGLGYLLNGNMCFGVLHDDLILRVGQHAAQGPLEQGIARVFDITGRAMKGWIMVPTSTTESDNRLHEWLTLAENFVLSLPPKEPDNKVKDPAKVSIRQIRNLGKVSAKALHNIGINNRAELEQTGPVAAYIQVREEGGKPSLNFLYAMVAGLRDLHWNALTREDKGELLRELDAWADMQQYMAAPDEKAK